MPTIEKSPETRVEPETEGYPKPKLWTRAECHRLVERGELEERYEFIEGIIYQPMTKHSPHIITLLLVYQWLVRVFGLDFVQKEDPIAFPGAAGKINEPEPNTAVLSRKTTSFLSGRPGPEDITLIVEVADSTLWFDRNTKARVYARAGVAEYWVMDVNRRQIYRHRKPGRNGYREIVTFGENETIAAPERTETVRIGELFAPTSVTNE